jgi:hypothetical protein
MRPFRNKSELLKRYVGEMDPLPVTCDNVLQTKLFDRPLVVVDVIMEPFDSIVIAGENRNKRELPFTENTEKYKG